MRNTICGITLAALVAIGPAPVEAGSSKEENIGVGTGSILGAVAGGPVGFIVGAAIGAKVGDTLHRKNREIDTLESSLDASNTTIANLERNLRALDREFQAVDGELEQLRATARPDLLSLLESGVVTDLLFRTGEHELAAPANARVSDLATTLASMPDIRIHLDGFADERGDEAYNWTLSEKRIDTVKQQLIDAGVDPSRIQVRAHGEAPAADTQPDSYALQRRVTLTLYTTDTEALASNPE